MAFSLSLALFVKHQSYALQAQPQWKGTKLTSIYQAGISRCWYYQHLDSRTEHDVTEKGRNVCHFPRWSTKLPRTCGLGGDSSAKWERTISPSWKRWQEQKTTIQLIKFMGSENPKNLSIGSKMVWNFLCEDLIILNKWFSIASSILTIYPHFSLCCTHIGHVFIATVSVVRFYEVCVSLLKRTWPFFQITWLILVARH